MNCLICLDVKVVDIFYLDIDCDGKCSKTSRVPCKVEFQGMGWGGDVDVGRVNMESSDFGGV